MVLGVVLARVGRDENSVGGLGHELEVIAEDAAEGFNLVSLLLVHETSFSP